MKKVSTPFPEVWIIEPDVFPDNRGFFFEWSSYQKFLDLGIDTTFVQDNHSKSSQNTVRGLHFQAYPGQIKLIRCTHGNVMGCYSRYSSRVSHISSMVWRRII